MPRPTGTPAYRRHKASGRAVVTINGRDFYLGPYGTKASKAEYDRLIGEWLASGRRLPGGGEVTVVEVVRAFWSHVKTYYDNPGGSDGEINSYRLALAKVKRLYGHTDAHAFGPLALKTVRQAMVSDGWCRTYVNSQVGRVRRMFKWAVEQEMVSAETWHALQAVSGLRSGKTDARESEPVKPVADAHVTAVLPHVSPQVAAMIRLQLLTGMRPGEVCQMRGQDIDTTGTLWRYRPATHKTKHRGHDRVIYLGRKAQELLRPFLKTDLADFLFSPADAEAWHRRQRSKARKTPLSCGNVPGSNRVGNPRRRPGGRYTVISYGSAIKRACDKAFPPPDPLNRRDGESRKEWIGRLTAAQKAELKRWRSEHSWHPHQLRHNAATRLRKDFGLEAAQVILGHKTLTVTQVYAEKNIESAQRVMAEVE
jgi:integrase